MNETTEMDFSELAIQIELHSVEGIRSCFQRGVSPNVLFKNQPLLYELIGEYTRSPRFKECVNVFVDYGLKWEDEPLLCILRDDAGKLRELAMQNLSIVQNRYSFRCAYTPFDDVTLLHICAEFNHVACAGVLITCGADVNARAGVDQYGFGGQSPIFHTVNQNGDHSKEMRELLLKHGADLTLSLRGLIWGKGHDWETFIPTVNPISYAMMGLLPQIHRDEKTISDTVARLIKHAFGIDYVPGNVPCRYLEK